jgi:hypothetical protein
VGFPFSTPSGERLAEPRLLRSESGPRSHAWFRDEHPRRALRLIREDLVSDNGPVDDRGGFLLTKRKYICPSREISMAESKPANASGGGDVKAWNMHGRCRGVRGAHPFHSLGGGLERGDLITIHADQIRKKKPSERGWPVTSADNSRKPSPRRAAKGVRRWRPI